MTEPPQKTQSLAAILAQEGFPALSSDEESLLVDYLSGAAGQEECQAAEALVESYPDLGTIMARVREEKESGDNNLESLIERLREIAKRQRREQAFSEAWGKLKDLARSLGAGMELEDFQLADFELAGAMLGGGGEGELFAEDLVSPLAGHSWSRTSFTVKVPSGASNPEFEVLDSEGEKVASHTDLVPGESNEFTFLELGMTEGSQYEWSLTFTSADGNDEVRSGMIIRSASEKQQTLDQLISLTASESEPLGKGLLECVLLYHHDVYHSLLDKLRSLYEESQPGEERRQVLLMLQRSYRKLRQFLSKEGFPEDSDRVLEQIAAVERELDESVLQRAA